MAARAHSVAGVTLGVACAGIKEKGLDVAVISFDSPSPTAAMFTKNRFAAAPVRLAQSNLRSGLSQAWLVNSGNANCGTGEAGMRVARGSCEHLGGLLNIAPKLVLPFSTGVIMEPLSASKLNAGIDRTLRKSGKATWLDAAKAIMTTDTAPKLASRRLKTRGAVPSSFTVSGIAKGAGMIHPDMATMLAFIVTDAKLPRSSLSSILKEAVAHSFNSISVDGDTSTNDAVVLAATGKSGEPSVAEQRSIADAINEVCAELADKIVADGEGATKVCTVSVSGFASNKACRDAANLVARSPLVKTMLHASDANIGRLLMAIGNTPARFDPEAVAIRINGKLAFSRGRRAASLTERKATAEMKKKKIQIDISVGSAKTSAKCQFCDLSKEYVSINSDYRT